ncbi:SCAN domain-containing protein 3 [Holothuria leucospilota]|uniref:SCAN domain-containing protein 3 n=1 Tax=Holothuria leucospilota TaxID=206669 RepID=A0A9Q1H8B8_HOLLE|nr:SCAN domain-containing protein 3 [Holothuria leucospilota]
MVRQYKKEYLQFGIVPIRHQPKCLFCKWMGSNESMKPNLLQRHFKNHPEYHNKPLDFFQRKKKEYEAEKRQAKKCYFTPKSSLKASFVAVEFIAKAKKPYSVGQELVLPCTKAIVKEMLGEQAAAKVGTVALSANTVRRRVMDLGEDIENQLQVEVLASPMFAIQIDESTDVSNKAILLVFVRYRGDERMVEDMLTCEELTGSTTAQEIFTKTDEYITGKGLVWANCVGVCTDGAAAMTGRHNGVVQLIKRVAPEAAATHCFLHRENLAAKDLSNELANIMDITVKVINLLRKNALKSRLFANLCNENEAEHTLLYFAAVRWLSRGRALERVFDLREEVHTFLQEKNSDLAEHFVDEEFLSTRRHYCA